MLQLNLEGNQDIGSWIGRSVTSEVVGAGQTGRERAGRWNGTSKAQRWRWHGFFWEQCVLYGLKFAGSKCLKNGMVGKDSSHGGW